MAIYIGDKEITMAYLGDLPVQQSTTFGYPIVTEGIQLYLDAGNTGSYVSGSSTWYDLSGNNYHATLIGNPTFNSSSAASLEFNGTSQYGTLYDIPYQLWSGSWTVQAWTNFGDFSPSALISQGSGSEDHGFHILARVVTGLSGYTYNIDFYTNGVRTDAAGSPGIDTWNFGTFTYDPSNLENNRNIFLNSVPQNLIYNQISSGSYEGHANNNTQLARIVWELAPEEDQYILSGSIGELVVYNRVLTEDEILSNFEATRTKYGI